MSSPVATSQRRRVLSSEAETMKRESAEKARSETPWSWPSKVWAAVMVGDVSESEKSREYVRMVLSAEEEPRRRPSEENLTQEIALLWPVRVSKRV